MEIPDIVETQVTIQHLLTTHTAQATLPNGKPVFAFIPHRDPAFPIIEQSHMRVRMGVADFSRAELLPPGS
jgi:hypothetical protein